MPPIPPDPSPPAFDPSELGQLTTVLGTQVRLWQPKKGYRMGMDAALLAAGCAGIEKPLKTALELGCGVGGALLSLKTRRPELCLTGIERDEPSLALAQYNLALWQAHNQTAKGSEDQILKGDIGHGFKAFGLERFDLVYANPPYFDDPSLLRAPHETKRAAWIADDGLEAWLDFAQAAVKDQGYIVFIHRADRLADLLAGLSVKCGGFIIRPVQPFEDQPAKRVLILAQRLSKTPLKLLAPLILHDRDERQHRPEIDALLKGETGLKWY